MEYGAQKAGQWGAQILQQALRQDKRAQRVNMFWQGEPWQIRFQMSPSTEDEMLSPCWTSQLYHIKWTCYYIVIKTKQQQN